MTTTPKPRYCGHHDVPLRAPQRRRADASWTLANIDAACPSCFPELFEAMLSCTDVQANGESVFPPEHPIIYPTYPGHRHLWPIYELLGNGVNEALTLHRDDGVTITYRIHERLGAGAELAT